MLPLSDAVGPATEVVDPERAVAIAYAPATIRPALTALFALDERFGAIVGATREPMVGLMRLAWWRETLEGLDATMPPAEPLLARVAAELPARGVSGAALAEIEDGWAALLDGEPDGMLDRHARARGGTLFALAARLLGVDEGPLRAAGEGWALADLGHRHSDAGVRAAARAAAGRRLAQLSWRWPTPTRPLATLVVLARRDAALAGMRRQGSPGRLLRMLALRLTGR